MKELDLLAADIRLLVLEMISRGSSSHIASAFSIAEIMAVLYGKHMNIAPDAVTSPDRDRFILSKGHAGAVVYATLARTGFITESDALEHCQDGSLFSGHVSHKGIPGVELSTGSLGHGLPVAAGLALAAKKQSRSYATFVVVGDGECNEGTTWETALFAQHNQLNNLTVIVDANNMQSLTTVEETIKLEPMADKWLSFGWSVDEVDGHSTDDLVEALNRRTQKPQCIIARTVKGKGVSYMENNILWHYRPPQGEDYDVARAELIATREQLES